MMIVWNEKTVRWFEEASAYTGFHGRLADILLQYIEHRGTLCDLGCGMSLADFNLALSIDHITCVDKDSSAICATIAGARKRGIENISAFEADARALQGQWDTVIAMFFGDFQNELDHYLSLAEHTFIAVVHGRPTGNIGPDGFRVRKCCYVDETSVLLKGKGLDYDIYEGSLEYGQPFRSMAEAEDFARVYSKNPPEKALSDYLEATLKTTGSPEYPIYMPNEKQFGIFVIKMSQPARKHS